MTNWHKFQQLPYETRLEQATEEAAFLSDPDMNQTRYIIPEGVKGQYAEIRPDAFQMTYRPRTGTWQNCCNTKERIFTLIDSVYEEESGWMAFRIRKENKLFVLRVKDVIVQEAFNVC